MKSQENKLIGNKIPRLKDFSPLTQSSPSPSFFKPVHKIIEQNAANNPYALAIRYNHHEVSYEQLNQSANRLAHYLINMKIGPEDRVVVLIEPSPDIIIALLGILKAQAVYVPLDPSYPRARIQDILNTIKPSAIISEKHLFADLNLDQYQLIQLNQLPDDLSLHNPEQILLASQTAYIFNTSGSTGIPKGVIASHANLAHFMKVALDSYGMNHNTVMPALARFSFSISLFELLSPLVAGGTVWIIDREQVLNPARMIKTLSQVSAFHAGPSLLKGLLSYIRAKMTDFTPFSRVHHVSTGGDMVPPELLESLKEVFSKAEVFVIYGSTEIACMGCSYPVPRGHTVKKTFVGLPFSNTDILLVDEHCNPVAHGVEGEICFAGDGVAPGYLEQPLLTKERFCNIEGKRFYRMGDIGRWHENEGLELLGRLDFQIKIRGMRVEIAEIEYQLRMVDGVKEAVVAAKNFGIGDHILLIAYVVFDDPELCDFWLINDHLVKQLPEYMIPTYYASLTELPLNHNMKLDRKALPDPSTLELYQVTKGPLRLPETATEKELAKLWCKLLGVNEAGLDDHFFDLGGHSILGIELLLHIETHFAVIVGGMEVLRESLESLALIIDERRGQQVQGKHLPVNSKSLPLIVDSFYFGPDSSLYGILYKPQQPVRKTVLICGPYPSELDCSLFILQQLARRLVRKDIAVMQFHYFGTADSAGEGVINDLKRWNEDIDAALKELTCRYPNIPTVGLGVRLGATLLWTTQSTSALERIILWDPVLDGQQYLKELARLHRQKVSGMMYDKNYRFSLSDPNKKEFLGISFTNSALLQFKDIAIQPSKRVNQSIIWIETDSTGTQCSTIPASQAKNCGWIIQPVTLNPTINWQSCQTNFPDTGISQWLSDAV